MTAHSVHNPESVPEAQGGYSQGVEVGGGARYLYISGQIPETSEGEVPAGFEAQCEAVWTNLEAVLASAEMDVGDLVKVKRLI